MDPEKKLWLADYEGVREFIEIQMESTLRENNMYIPKIEKNYRSELSVSSHVEKLKRDLPIDICPNAMYDKQLNGFLKGHPCLECEKEGIYRCSGCQLVYYCSKKCQKKDWKRHKVECFFKPKKTPQKKNEIKASKENEKEKTQEEQILDDFSDDYIGRELKKSDIGSRVIQIKGIGAHVFKKQDFTNMIEIYILENVVVVNPDSCFPSLEYHLRKRDSSDLLVKTCSFSCMEGDCMYDWENLDECTKKYGDNFLEIIFKKIQSLIQDYEMFKSRCDSSECSKPASGGPKFVTRNYHNYYNYHHHRPLPPLRPEFYQVPLKLEFRTPRF